MLVCDLSEVAAMLDVSSLGTLVSFLDPIVVEVSRVLGYICRDLALVVGVGFEGGRILGKSMGKRVLVSFL